MPQSPLPLIDYLRPRPGPAYSHPPSPGILTNASALIALIVGTGAIATAVANTVTSPLNSDWDLFKSSLPVVLGGCALLLMEFRAYFHRSITASTIVGITFLLLGALLLFLLHGETDLIPNPRHPLESLLMLTPFAIILTASAGHFTWARQLLTWKRSQ